VKELKEIEELCLTYKQVVPANNEQAHLILKALIDKLNSFKQNELTSSSALTKREQEVLSYASKGFTNREIASALSIGTKTIEFHLKNTYEKCEASNRSEAITFALGKSWIKA
jgi:DNA-binding NarL/FixJ family response regulator